MPWAWLLLVGGVVIIFTCQICAIGYIYCFHRGRYEGRNFWYRGRISTVLDGARCCSTEQPALSPVMAGELQHDLRNGRAYWSGNWGRDYRFHVANFHPLISVFCCHPLHPFGKVARAIVLAITVAFMVGWRRFVQESIIHLPGDWDEEISGRMGLAKQLFHLDVRGPLVIFCYVTLPSMLVELFLTRLAMLHDSISDFHREYGDRACCTKFVGWFITLMGWLACTLFYVLACASLAFLVYTVYMVRNAMKLGVGTQELCYFVVIIPWTLAQIWGLWWFVFDIIMPFCGFGLCHFCEGVPCFWLLRWQWWVEEEAMVQEPTWRVADTAHALFGAEVEDDSFADENASILREEAGLVHDWTTKRWIAVERVAQKDLEAWVSSKMSGARRGEVLLTQVEEQRAQSLRLRENECVELVPCCYGGSKRARDGYSYGFLGPK